MDFGNAEVLFLSKFINAPLGTEFSFKVSWIIYVVILISSIINLNEKINKDEGYDIVIG